MLTVDAFTSGHKEVDSVISTHLDSLLNDSVHTLSYGTEWGTVQHTTTTPEQDIAELQENANFFIVDTTRSRIENALYNRIYTIAHSLKEKGVPLRKHSISIHCEDHQYEYSSTIQITSRSMWNLVRECLGRLTNPQDENLLPLTIEMLQDDIRSLGINTFLLHGFFKETLNVNTLLENIRRIS